MRFLSKDFTFNSALLVILTGVFMVFDIEVQEDDLSQVVSAIGVLVGGTLAAFSRWKNSRVDEYHDATYGRHHETARLTRYDLSPFRIHTGVPDGFEEDDDDDYGLKP